VFVRKQKIKNKDGSIRTYLQICESVRIDGKPRPIVQMNLGRIDNDDGRRRVESLARLIIESAEVFAFLNVHSDVASEWTKNYGYHLVFSKIWQDLKFDEIFETAFADANTDYDIPDCIYNMTLNRVSYHCFRQVTDFAIIFGLNL